MAHAAFHIAIDMHVRIAINATAKMHRMKGQPLCLPLQQDEPSGVSVIAGLLLALRVEHSVGMTVHHTAITCEIDHAVLRLGRKVNSSGIFIEGALNKCEWLPVGLIAATSM